MFRTPLIGDRVSRLLITLALTVPGCKNDVDDPEDGDGGDTDGIVCPDCPAGQEVYLCIISGIEKPQCFDNLAQAQASCGVVPGDGVAGNVPMPCDNQTPPDPDVSWTPGSFVAYDEASRTHEIDRDFLLNVLDEPHLLLLDRARLEWRGDRFEFEGIDRGNLADLLGFVDGDALSEINGYPLSTMEEIANAYEALREQSEFSVSIVRDEATLVLTYRIIDDS